MTTEIISDLKGENNNAFGQLYKEHFKMVSRFVTSNNGQIDDAEYPPHFQIYKTKVTLKTRKPF